MSDKKENIMKTKCPRQKAFIEHLIKLFASKADAERTPQDIESITYFIKEFERFVNNWCPTLKDL